MMVTVIMMIMVMVMMTIMIIMIAMNEEWWLLYAHDGDNGDIDKKSDDNGAVDDDG